MSQSRWKWVWHTLVPCLVGGQAAAVAWAMRPGMSADPDLWLRIGVVGIGLGGWTLLCVWTFRRLLWRRDPETGRISPVPGVLGFGLPICLVMAAMSVEREVGGAVDRLSVEYAGAVLHHVVIGFPIYAWGGRWFDSVTTTLMRELLEGFLGRRR